jgi:hypothetical protein
MTAAVVAAAALLLAGGHAPAQAPGPATAMPQQANPFAVEYYYKVKWGYFDEFMTLYKKNHLPVLRRLKETGRIIEMSAAFPVNHAGEDRRWDMRFTIVYRDVAAAHEDTPEAIVRELFPDQATFKREEQRRFELLLEHMDIPVTIDDLRDWP